MNESNPVAGKLRQCFTCLRQKTDFVPKLALVLGSGLGDYAEQMKTEAEVDYHEIDGFPVSTVTGHKGRFLFGRIGDVPIVCMQGRVHYYEGYDMSDVVLPIRLMRLAGAQALILTNAAGGIREDLCPGDLMLIKDQISSFVPSPLTGPNLDELGERFPDMSQIYDKELIRRMELTAASLDLSLKQGVYVQMRGPQ